MSLKLQHFESLNRGSATMESDSAMDSDSDAEAPEKRGSGIMSYMYFFEAKIN